MARLPKQRRTGLFSATQTVRVCVGGGTRATGRSWGRRRAACGAERRASAAGGLPAAPSVWARARLRRFKHAFKRANSKPQEAVEALTRAGLRNPVRVAVAVTDAPPPAPAAGGKKAAKGGGGGGTGDAGDGGRVTPATLQLQYVLCEVDEKLGQLVGARGDGVGGREGAGWGSRAELEVRGGHRCQARRRGGPRSAPSPAPPPRPNPNPVSRPRSSLPTATPRPSSIFSLAPASSTRRSRCGATQRSRARTFRRCTGG
jgi:hypothetical protein